MSRLRPQDAARRRALDAGPDFSEALARGLKLLAAFNAPAAPGESGRVPAGLTLSDLARRVDLPRATVRRSLNTLAAMGYVQTEAKLHRLTPKVLQLAAAYLTSNTVSTLLQPACDRIAAAVGESCTAAVLEADEVVMVARALPAQLVPGGTGIGYRLPAYCSALGRVLLAALPDASLDAYFARTRLAPVTDRTLTDAATVRARVAAAGAQGFAYVDQEAEYGFRSVAVPVRRFDGTLAAALNIGARAERADEAAMLGRFLDILRAEAAVLSGAIV